MKVAYADPPYIGCAHLYPEHPEAYVYDTVDGHRALIARLVDEFPDGWALSLHAPSLRVLLPLTPADCRVSPWVKPFASYKPGVNPAYCWEPVIWRGGRRRRSREESTVRDYVSANIALQKGLRGAKPMNFCLWIIDLLGVERGDELIDLFPGSGSMGRALEIRERQQRLFA